MANFKGEESDFYCVSNSSNNIRLGHHWSSLDFEKEKNLCQKVLPRWIHIHVPKMSFLQRLFGLIASPETMVIDTQEENQITVEIRDKILDTNTKKFGPTKHFAGKEYLNSETERLGNAHSSDRGNGVQ